MNPQSTSFLPSPCCRERRIKFETVCFIRQVISDHPKVAECSCIGIDDALTGQAIAAFAVLKQGVSNTPEVKQDIINLIRNRIGTVCFYLSFSSSLNTDQSNCWILFSKPGAIATPKILQIVNALPKTRSGLCFMFTSVPHVALAMKLIYRQSHAPCFARAF